MPRWVPAGSTTWANALDGGYESSGIPLYVARATYAGGIHPGKAAPHLGACNIGYGGKEVVVSNFELLCLDPDENALWKSTYLDVGYSGCQESNGQSLYVARGSYGGGLHIGKAGSHLAGCNIGYGGAEVILPTYEYLNISKTPAPATVVEKLFIVIGKTGNGKSTLINHFNCDRQAPASGSNASVTRKSEVYRASSFSASFIDTAGFGDNKGKSNEETLQEVLAITKKPGAQISGVIFLSDTSNKIEKPIIEVFAFLARMNPALLQKVIVMFPRALDPEGEVEILQRNVRTIHPSATLTLMHLPFDRKAEKYYDITPLLQLLNSWTSSPGVRPVI